MSLFRNQPVEQHAYARCTIFAVRVMAFVMWIRSRSRTYRARREGPAHAAVRSVYVGAGLAAAVLGALSAVQRVPTLVAVSGNRLSAIQALAEVWWILVPAVTVGAAAVVIGLSGWRSVRVRAVAHPLLWLAAAALLGELLLSDAYAAGFGGFQGLDFLLAGSALAAVATASTSLVMMLSERK